MTPRDCYASSALRRRSACPPHPSGVASLFATVGYSRVAGCHFGEMLDDLGGRWPRVPSLVVGSRMTLGLEPVPSAGGAESRTDPVFAALSQTGDVSAPTRLSMDTDEYEMSLVRELAVCRGHIEAIEQSLARSEERDRTGAAGAGAELESGAAAAADAKRASQREALDRWRTRAREYEALLRAARNKH